MNPVHSEHPYARREHIDHSYCGKELFNTGETIRFASFRIHQIQFDLLSQVGT